MTTRTARRTHRRTAATTLTTALLSLGLVVPVAPAHATSPRPAPMCQGERATIVGNQNGDDLRGTSGADVIVTNGALDVYPGKGADRVCVTASRGKLVTVVDAGGADRVKVVGRANVTAYLGGGADVYRGGPGRDDVSASTTPSGAGSADRASDDVRTGAGPDLVFAGPSDVVRLGRGDDQYVLFTPGMSAAGSVGGGPGTDELVVRERLPGDVVVDASTGVGTSDGAASLRFGGMETYYLTTKAAGSLRFVGSSRSEELRSADSRVVRAEMGGGDDRAGGVISPNSDIELDGGPGSDVYGFYGFDLDVDLTAGTASSTLGVAATYSGFEAYEPKAEHLSVVGTDGPDVITSYGCRVVVSGGAGADVLALSEPFPDDDFCVDEEPSFELYGEAGDDTLVGNRLDNLLDGGPDTDTADGRAGTDQCLAEQQVRCES